MRQRNARASAALTSLIDQRLAPFGQFSEIQQLGRRRYHWRSWLCLRRGRSVAEENHPRAQHSANSADKLLSLHALSPSGKLSGQTAYATPSTHVSVRGGLSSFLLKKPPKLKSDRLELVCATPAIGGVDVRHRLDFRPTHP